MSDVKFTVVGDGDLNSLEGDLARLEKRLENVETRGRRALSATAAGVSAADSLERQRVQQAATDARLWFDRLRTDQPAAAPPTGRHSTLLSNLSAASQASGRSLIQELDSRRGPVALDPRALAEVEHYYKNRELERLESRPDRPMSPFPAIERISQEENRRRFQQMREERYAAEHGGGNGGGGGSGRRMSGAAGDDDGLGDIRRQFGELGHRASDLRQHTSRAALEIGTLTAGIGSLSIAGIAAAAGIGLATEMFNREAQAAVDARIRFEGRERTLAVSTGLPRDAMGDVNSALYRRSYQYGTTSQFAFDVVDAATRSGLSLPEAMGETGRTYFDIAAALNATSPAKGEVAPKEIVDVLAGMLRANQLPTTRDNLLRYGSMMRAAYAGQMELQDLPQFGKNMAGYRADGLTDAQALAAGAALRDVAIPAPDAATGLRMVSSRLRTAGKNPAKLRALARLGLTPDMVDLVGEDLPTALERLNAKRAGTNPVEFSAAMKTIFEERGRTYAETLMTPDRVAAMRDYESKMRDPKSLDAYVQEATTGAAAAAARRNLTGEMSPLAHKTSADAWERLSTMEALHRAEGRSEIEIWLRSTLAHAMTGTTRLWNGTERAADLALSLSDFRVGDLFDAGSYLPGAIGPAGMRARKAVEDLHSGRMTGGAVAEAMLSTLEKIEKNTAKPVPPARPMPKAGTAEKESP